MNNLDKFSSLNNNEISSIVGCGVSITIDNRLAPKKPWWSFFIEGF